MIEIKNKAGEVIYVHDDITLRNANLRYANLRNVNLCGKNLRFADLSDADLRFGDLNDADLRNVNLSYTDLRSSNLSNANLNGAVLCNVDLSGANLNNTDLSDTDLSDAYLHNVDLSSTKLPDFQIPQNVDLTVWGKKNGVLVEMKVPQSAKRTSCLINRKCRAEFVDVIKVHNTIGKVVVVNEYCETIYENGKRVYPHDYCDDIRIDCAPGIHFWLTKEEAEAW